MENKNQKKSRKINIPLIMFTIINVIFNVVLTFFVASLNILPIKYLILIIIFLLIMDIICFMLIKNKKTGLKITGVVISIILMIVSIIGSYYISKTNDFLNNAFDNGENSYKNTYYVLVKENSKYEKIEDLKYGKLGYYTNMPNIKEALDKLNETIESDEVKYEDLNKIFDELDRKKIDATLVESTIYKTLTEEAKIIDKDDYKIIYEFEVVIEEEIEEKEDDGNNFSIYIGGTDFTQKNNDFNMVVTINKKTHKILLTSIPRDFYVDVAGVGMKDLLGYAGYFGINTSRKTMENLFDTNIDYYVKINTNSLVGLVDILGGIEFCSDYSYTTTHAMILDSYDDSKGQKLRVTKGCKNYNGIQILTIARERLAFKDGDRQRQRNCQAIMISIFKKMTSAENIANYSNVLNAVSDLYSTNIPKELVTELAKDTLNNGSKWSFIQQSVTGRDSSANVHLNTVRDYVMIPNEESIEQAKAEIKKIKSGK